MGVEVTADRATTLVLTRGAIDELAWLEIDDECVVWSDRTQELHRLDRIATLIFNSCDGSRPLSEVIDQLATLFGMSPESIESDVRACAQVLIDSGLVLGRT